MIRFFSLDKPVVDFKKPESSLLSVKLFLEFNEMDFLVFVESMDCVYAIIEWVHTKNSINLRITSLININTFNYLTKMLLRIYVTAMTKMLFV